MKKILVTGGSGFIGTNLVEKLCENTEYEILNIEIAKPKVPNHLRFWKNVDLLNLDALSEVISDFRPDSVIHLLYGMSKVETERLIKQANLPFIWSIIRPTSILGALVRRTI